MAVRMMALVEADWVRSLNASILAMVSESILNESGVVLLAMLRS